MLLYSPRGSRTLGRTLPHFQGTLVSRVYQFHPQLEQGANERRPKPIIDSTRMTVG